MKTRTALILLLVLSIIPVIDLLQPGLPLTHDGKDHVARIANFYQNLSEGIVIPRWGANLNWGYGHPVLMFLYPLPSYFASIFHFLSFSFVDSVKMVFAVSYIASGLAIFIWLRKITSPVLSLLGSVLYLYAPYRFVDLYVRGAIGEHVAFIFPPLIAYFFLKVSKEKKYTTFIFASLSLAGLILAHNAISLMVLPLLIIYGIYLIYKAKDKVTLFLTFLSIGFLGFALSAFFWVPAFFEGKYTLRDIVTQLDFAERLYPFSDFLFSPWGYGVSGNFSLQIGIAHLFMMTAGLVIGLILLRGKKRNEGFLLISLFLITIITIILMTPFSLPLWDSVSILQKFQFPWRLLTMVVIFTSLIGVFATSFLPKKYHLIVLFIVIVVVLLQPHFWQRQATFNRPESYYTGIYESTTDTGESSPLWSTRFMEKHFIKPIELIGGVAEVISTIRTSTHHQYKTEVIKDAQFVENTVYFPGWVVLIDGVPADVVYQNELHRGLMTFYVPVGSHTVDVKFGDTKLRSAANSLSVLGVILLFAFPYLFYRQTLVSLRKGNK